VREAEGRYGAAAALAWLGPYGEATAGISDLEDGRYAYVGLNGALVWMAGHAFAARRIDQAFALVSTEGAAGVPVRVENRDAGTTDADGLLLVTPLHAYQNNQLEIDPMKLPADVRIERVKAIATPGDRAGIVVRFPVVPVQSALVTLIDDAGKPLPLGSRARLDDRVDEALVVGFDGALYLDALEERGHRLHVHKPDGATCLARFDYRRQPGRIAQIGPLPCSGEQP
jgi:outer membrane usher protein